MATRFNSAQTLPTGAINTLADELHNQVGASTTNVAASPVVMTAAQALAGVYIQDTDGAFGLTLPTAALVVAAMANPQVGSKFLLAIINTGNNTTTITIGSGNTAAGQGTLTLATNTSNLFIAEVTNITAGAEAIKYHALLKTAS